MLLIYMVCLTIFLSTVMKKKTEVYPVSILFMVGTVYATNEILSIGNNLNKLSLMVVYSCLILLFIGLIIHQKKKGKLQFSLNRDVWRGKEKWETV